MNEDKLNTNCEESIKELLIDVLDAGTIPNNIKVSITGPDERCGCRGDCNCKSKCPPCNLYRSDELDTCDIAMEDIIEVVRKALKEKGINLK